jgi:glucose-6-phosphate 1-dehydrogenase
MQNLMVFRMANALVEAAWNRNFIQEVCILAAESQGVEHRGRYYDENGVLRDTFMNSLLKILAISAMEPPSSLDGEAVRDETAKVIRAIQPLNPANVNDQLVLGQYQSGWVRGAPVPGYRKEPGVARGSITPTYAALKTFIDNERWRGVPFYLVTGKRLPTRETRVVVRFRETSHGTMFQTSVPGVPPNTLVLSLQPEEKALVTIQIRTPGANLGLRPLQMEFGFLDGYEGPELEPYEWGLLDVMAGDPLMFWRRDGLEAAWAFISPILEAATPGAGTVVHEYDAGTWGPADTSRLVPHLAWSDD